MTLSSERCCRKGLKGQAEADGAGEEHHDEPEGCSGDFIQCHNHKGNWPPNSKHLKNKKLRTLQNFWYQSNELHSHLMKECALAGNILKGLFERLWNIQRRYKWQVSLGM